MYMSKYSDVVSHVPLTAQIFLFQICDAMLLPHNEAGWVVLYLMYSLY